MIEATASENVLGFVVRRHVYVESSLNQLITKLLTSDRKKRALLKKLFLEGKTFGYKISLLEKVVNETGQDKGSLICKLKDFNELRNCIVHHAATFSLKDVINEDFTKPKVVFKNKKIILNEDFMKSYHNLAKQIDKLLEDFIWSLEDRSVMK
jgi:hypothetical protein